MSRAWVVCYDIADNRRRSAVSTVLETWGIRVQESVFEVFLDSRDLVFLRSTLAQICDWVEDSVRYYPVCQHCRAAMTWQGRAEAAAVSDFFVA